MARHFTKQQVLDAISGSGGIISAIAGRLGCGWHTADTAIGKWEETKAAYRDEEQKILDLAESKIVAAIQEGSLDAAKYYLGKKGRKRGYGDVLSFETDNPLPVKIVVENAGTGTKD